MYKEFACPMESCKKRPKIVVATCRAPYLEKDYIFSKNVFLIFQEMELSSPKIRKFLRLSGLSPQNLFVKNVLYFLVKNLALIKFLIFSQKQFF